MSYFIIMNTVVPCRMRHPSSCYKMEFSNQQIPRIFTPMKRFTAILVWTIWCFPLVSVAKEAKPTLLVYGAGIEAFAAAIQSARSNVPTLWVVNDDASFHQDTESRISIQSNHHLDSGIWLELLTKAGAADQPNDSVAIAVKKDLSIRLLVNAMDQIIKQERNLTVVQGTDIASLHRNRNSWRVSLQNKTKYQVRSVVDASLDGRLDELISNKPDSSATLRNIDQLSLPQTRTVVAVGTYQQKMYAVCAADILAQQSDNIFRIQPITHSINDNEGIPLRAHIGQAIGAAAAYCAFFRTDAKHIDLRKWQTELISFKMRLFPWSNVRADSPHYMTLQKAYLTTIFGEDSDYSNSEFTSDANVQIDHIRAVFNQYYSRSQLWFIDNTSNHFSVGDLLSFLKVLAFRGDELDAEIQKDWSRKLHFEGEYDVNRTLSRLEFAVLVDRYANPFSKTVTIDGAILR